jgi:hypothetical protein
MGESKPWFLMTNVEKLPARKLSKVFGKQMSIEEYFRDTNRQDGLRQSKRNGFALRLTLIKDSERLSRFLLILALAYILLVTIGLYATKRFRPRQWCSNNRVKECSLFTIGKVMLLRQLPKLKYLLKGLRNEILLAESFGLQKWG